MKYLLLLTCLLCGCSMSVDDVIRDVKKCEAAGMKGLPYISVTGRITAVQCVPLPPSPHCVEDPQCS